MELKKLVDILKKPETYTDQIVYEIGHIQTHISHVFLTGKFAYKIKKPVNFGFLDFSTLKKRKFYCEKELELNRRLSPEIYLEVIALTEKNGNIEFNGKWNVIEYAVKMKQIPQKYIMTNLIKEKKIDKKTITDIAEILNKFYNEAGTDSYINSFGSMNAIKKNTDENFEQTKEFIHKTITKQQHDFIKTAANDFLLKNKLLFEKRIRDNKIMNCHGDLHSGNIFAADRIYIFDCIEFNERFRYGDTASDIAFLAMDLDFLNENELSEFFIRKYTELSKDEDLIKVLNFYKCYRAFVRGKVTGFKLHDASSVESEEIKKTAGRYFELAYKYAKNM